MKSPKVNNLLWAMAVCLALAVGAITGAWVDAVRFRGTRGFRQSLLFSREGREFSYPSTEFCRRFDEAPEKERARLVEEMIDLVKRHSGGYSRLVAAAGLIQISHAHDGRYLSNRAAEAVAKHVIRVADPVPSEEVTPGMLTCDTVGPPFRELLHLSRPYYNLIHVRCVVQVDQHDIILAEGLPGRNWQCSNPRVLLDGKPIEVSPFTHPFENGPPIASADILGNLSEDKLYGEHTITSKVTVIAPNGSEFELERKVTLKVMTRDELFSQ